MSPEIGVRTINHVEICPLENCPPDNCPPKNVLFTIKFPSKVIAPTQVKSPQRVQRMNCGKLCIIYEYYNLRIISPNVIFQGCNFGVKSDLLLYIFYRY